MSFKSALQCVLTAVVLLGLMAVGASAQGFRGSLSGQVTDPSGAVIPGAKVSLKDNATNTVTTVGASVKGLYSVPNLLPGTYTVTATASGFQTLVRNNIVINAGVAFGLDMKLTVGSQSQEVSVTAAPILNTESAAQNTTLSTAVVSTLPLPGDNVFLLAQRAPGANNGANEILSERPFDNGGEDAFSFNGAPAGGNNNQYLIDGMPNNNNEGMGFVPAPDAVSEITVMTNEYDAEYGHTAGGTVSVALKGGANQYHGDAYWDLRNNHLNGNLFQNNRIPNFPTQVTQWSVPGFQVGGPVVIPGLYNGHNKTFFSVSYQHYFDKIPSTVSRAVPSASQAAGDFCSGAPGNNGVGTVIYDPTTTDTNTADAGYGTRTAFGGCPSGQTGSIIPANRIDPVTANLSKFVPGATVAGCTNALSSGCANNFQAPNAHGDTYYATTERVDETLSPTESFFASYEAGNRLEFIDNPENIGSNSAYYPPYNTWRINHGAGFNLTSILSPTTVSTFAVSWLRNDGLGLGTLTPGITATAAGFGANLPGLFGQNNFPGVGNLFPNYFGNGWGTDSTTLGDFWTVSETVSKVRGAHNVKFGFLTTITTTNNKAEPLIPTPGYSVNFTQNTAVASKANPLDPLSGSQYASQLLGYPSSMSFTNPLSRSFMSRYLAAFVQDSWRVNSKLTLTLGLRWDTQILPIERYNRQVVGFNPAAPAAGALVNPCGPGDGCPVTAVNGLGGNYIGGYQFASAGQRSSGPTYLFNWSPRFGFAYQLSPKYVLQGGWGRFIDYAATNFPGAPGYQQATAMVASPDGNLTPTLCANTAGCAVPAGNPLAGLAANGYASAFPNGLIPATNSTLGAGTGIGNSVSYVDPNWRPDYTDQFNLAVETQLPSHIVLKVAYSGSRSYRIPMNINLNEITEAQYLTLGNALSTQVGNPFCAAALVNGKCTTPLYPGTSLSGPTVSVQQLALPYPQFTQVTEDGVPEGRSWYNSLQISVNKRISHGLTFNSNYTWAKNISTNSQLNPYDPTSPLMRALGGTPMLINFAGSWQMPWQGGSNAFVRGIAGGWNVALDESIFSGGYMGTPGGVTWTGVNPMTPVGAFKGPSDSPNALTFNPCVANIGGASIGGSIITSSSQAAGCPAATPMSQVPWELTPSIYVNTTVHQIGTMRRPFWAAPTTNLTIHKSFSLGESRAFTIQAEAYNLTNTPQFGGGGNGAGVQTSATSTSFGQVNPNQGNDPRTIQITGRITF